MVKNVDLQNIITDQVEVVKQKRGRKPKKPVIENDNKIENNIVFSIQESNNDTNDVIDINDTNDVIINNQEEQKTGGKKRGRKPKGGKIIQNVVPMNINKESKPNVILHLKCFLKDLQTNTLLNNIESFQFSGKNEMNYEIISTNNTKSNNNNKITTKNMGKSDERSCCPTSTHYGTQRKEDSKVVEKRIEEKERSSGRKR